MFNYSRTKVLIRKVVPELQTQFGTKDIYNSEEVNGAIKNLGLSNQKNKPYIHATFCNKRDFYSIYDFKSIDYDKLRIKVAKTILGAKIQFSTNLIIQAVLGNIEPINEYITSSEEAGHEDSSASDIDAGGGD